ncbi:MAG: type II toxin-antitoxin system Phd/YefM family antitoxin [Candidatus Electrothrix sp. AUS4]|nr:type II toxin-antitoxin system Phd/YefM family antitoxin [Candidatus Electrothrix sp. AUS4]
MQASVVDLRYKMNDVLKALERNEKVSVLYRGKIKGVLVPSTASKQDQKKKISEHPFFGMASPDSDKSVAEKMDELRGGRYRDI